MRLTRGAKSPTTRRSKVLWVGKSPFEEVLLGVATVAVIAMSFAAATASASEIPFDQGVDVRSIVETVRHEPGSAVIAPAGIQYPGQWMPGCTDKILMAPSVSRSAVYELASTELVEECRPPGPRDPGNCRPTTGRTIRRKAQLVIRNRPATNQVEVFKLCLTRDDLSVIVVTSAVRYDSAVVGDTVVLEPRAPEAPLQPSRWWPFPWPPANPQDPPHDPRPRDPPPQAP